MSRNPTNHDERTKHICWKHNGPRWEDRPQCHICTRAAKGCRGYRLAIQNDRHDPEPYKPTDAQART